MGCSLGSIPSVHISSISKIHGLILISPISIIEKKNHSNWSVNYEDFNQKEKALNLNKVFEIKCPIFLIHGKLDEITPISVSYEILDKIKNPNTWFPKIGTHTNIFIESYVL